MKKGLTALMLAICLLFSSCTTGGDHHASEHPTEYCPVTAINHCVVEPDVRALLTERDMQAYRRLMEGMLSRSAEVKPDPETVTVDYLLDLLRKSPYFFFLKKAQISGDTVSFSYAYTAAQQTEMLTFIDSEILRIANRDADPEDNELDVILKIYLAVTHLLQYDRTRTDNKMLGSPLFDYPADEIYKALRDKKSLCYGFAYIMRFALLQHGVDCFCVYGLCTSRGDGHEWVIFRYDDQWFHCDPTWDRVSDDYAKLIHFGKTDREREVDTLVTEDFSSYHDPGFGKVECTDKRFGIFRGMSRFSYISGHRYYMTDIHNNEYVFDTGTFSFDE